MFSSRPDLCVKMDGEQVDLAKILQEYQMGSVKRWEQIDLLPVQVSNEKNATKAVKDTSYKQTSVKAVFG